MQSPALDAGDGSLPNAIGCGCRASLFNFIMMATCFSINHGVATALIALASSEFEEGLGGYSTGVLYACYTLSALLMSTGVVKKIGAKHALCTGLFAYCAYVSAFLVASVVSTKEARWAAVLVGSAISGDQTTNARIEHFIATRVLQIHTGEAPGIAMAGSAFGGALPVGVGCRSGT